MAKKTKEEAQVTRCRLLDAAERVFHRQGVSRTTMEDIAKAAGVTRGAVYWHFRDKVDVFTTLMERLCLPQDNDAASREALAPSEALPKLRAYTRYCN